jgi:hypothetical protein
MQDYYKSGYDRGHMCVDFYRSARQYRRIDIMQGARSGCKIISGML